MTRCKVLDDKDYKEYQKELAALNESAVELYNSINIPSLRDRLIMLENETLKDNFWKDKENGDNQPGYQQVEEEGRAGRNSLRRFAMRRS